jgi:hypothetical protein
MGRLQTRFAVIAVIGSIWTAMVSPLLPGGGSLGDRYQTTFSVLAVVLVAGLVWELVYHFLQQFRWEKDWPTFFGLVTGINEGLAAWLIVQAGWAPGQPDPSVAAFAWHFATTWIVLWLWVNGPMRVPFIRWRYRGGRLI